MGSSDILLLLLLLTAKSLGASNNKNGLSALRSAFSDWSSSHSLVAKETAKEGARQMASKLEGMKVEDLFSADTLKKLRTPLSEMTTFSDTHRVQITSSLSRSGDANETIVSSPFGQMNILDADEATTGKEILDLVFRSVNMAAGTSNLAFDELFATLLNTAIDASVFSFPELVGILTQALGEVSGAMNPVPEYLNDTEVLEADGSPMRYHDLVQDNWAGTLKNTRAVRTYYPHTRQGIINIVKKAKSEDARVRVTGLKHSWNHWLWGLDNRYEEAENPCYPNGFSGDVDYFIAMLPWELTDPLYFLRADVIGWATKAQELTFVQGPLDTWTGDDGKEHASVKVGGAALSSFLHEWGIHTGWFLPSEPMTGLFTLSGTVSTASHGSGRKHPSVSDQVIAMEYVDEKGEVQYVDDQDELNAVAASYGLFGVILSITFRVDKMTHAPFQSRLVGDPLEEFFPRPGSGKAFNESLLQIFEENYYQSFYTYPSHYLSPGNEHVRMTVFTWKEDEDPEGCQRLIPPDHEKGVVGIQFLLQTITQIMDRTLTEMGTKNNLYWSNLNVFHSYLDVFGSSFPIPVKTFAPDAIHFLKGFHANPVRNFEINVPIRDDGYGNPEWTTVTDVYWLVLDTIDEFESRGLFPVDMLVEMRLIGGSDRILDSYYGNKHGAVSIDPTSSMLVPDWLWDKFRAELFKRFYLFDNGDNVRKPRPHLAKEPPTNVAGRSSEEYYRAVFGDQLDLFVAKYRQIVKSRGSRVKDSVRRFSTKFFDNIFQGCPRG